VVPDSDDEDGDLDTGPAISSGGKKVDIDDLI